MKQQISFTRGRAEPLPFKRALACAFSLSLAAGCAQTPSVVPTSSVDGSAVAASPGAAASALDAYIAIDREELVRSASGNSFAAALLSILDREPNGADRLLALTASLQQSDLKERLFYVGTDQMIAAHRWDDLLQVVSSTDGQEGFADFVRPYAGWPDSSVDYGESNVTEVPFDGLHIPALLNGQPIELAFDTGAPSVGVHHDFIDLLETDQSSPQRFALPAFDIVALKYHGLIDSLTIGDFTLQNVAASVGAPPSEEDQASFDRMEQITGRHDIIMGLDALRPYFDTVEFDYNRNVVRLIRNDPRPPAAANMIMGDGRKPLIRLRTQNRVGNYYIDTGSYGHLLGEGAFDIRDCDAQRTMSAPWRDIVETRVQVAFDNGDPVEVWAQPGSLVTEPEWDLFGYIGNPRRGVYRIDMRSGHFAFEDYSSIGLDSLWPISAERDGTCETAAPTE